MLCCYSYKSIGGNCCVCQKLCTTRACNCMYLHKECSKKLLNFYGNNCRICKKKFKTWFLQSCPPDTNDEVIFIKKCNEAQLIKKRTLNLELKKKINILAPCVLQLYMYLEGATSLNVKLLLDDICNDNRLKLLLYQKLLNCGIKNEECKELIQFLTNVNKNYDIFHNSSKKLLKQIFKKHLVSHSTWEEPCFDTIL